MNEMFSCTRCPELARIRTQVVGGEFINPEAIGTLPLMFFVARNPGRNEDEQGRPLVGQSGKLARRVLSDFTDKFCIYLTNLVKCFTPDNRVPSPTEILNCQEYIDHEVRSMVPSVAVLAGKESQQYRFGEHDRHKVRMTDEGTLWIATYHPAARMNAEPVIRKDIWALYMAYSGVN